MSITSSDTTPIIDAVAPCPHDNVTPMKKITKFGRKCGVCAKRFWKIWKMVKCLDCKKTVHKSCAKESIEMTILPVKTTEKKFLTSNDIKTITDAKSAVSHLSSPKWTFRDLYLGPIRSPKTLVLSQGWENQAFTAEDQEKEADERRSREWRHERDWSRMKTAKMLTDFERRFGTKVEPDLIRTFIN